MEYFLKALEAIYAVSEVGKFAEVGGVWSTVFVIVIHPDSYKRGEGVEGSASGVHL